MRRGRRPKSEYGTQLAEKQQVKNSYAIRERRFKRYFNEGKDPEKIGSLLESRLDNVVFRAGFAPTRKSARQLVSHGHVQVNGRNVNISSYEIRIGDVVSIHPSSINIGPLKDLEFILKKHEAPVWISLDIKNISAKINSMPKIDEHLISSSIKPVVEFYSR